MKTQEILENVTELKLGVEYILAQNRLNLNSIDNIMGVIDQIVKLCYEANYEEGYEDGYNRCATEQNWG